MKSPRSSILVRKYAKSRNGSVSGDILPGNLSDVSPRLSLGSVISRGDKRGSQTKREHSNSVLEFRSGVKHRNSNDLLNGDPNMRTFQVKQCDKPLFDLAED